MNNTYNLSVGIYDMSLLITALNYYARNNKGNYGGSDALTMRDYLKSKCKFENGKLIGFKE